MGSISVDMHPYDIDANGNGPQIVTFPFVASPTMSPTPCQGSDFTVELRTDNYAYETSWTVEDSAGDVVMENDFLEDAQLYQTTACLSPGVYTFQINDSYGDGICCGYGQGYYTLTLDGVEIASGGNF